MSSRAVWKWTVHAASTSGLCAATLTSGITGDSFPNFLLNASTGAEFYCSGEVTLYMVRKEF